MHGTTEVLCESKGEVEGYKPYGNGLDGAVQPLACVSGAQAEAPFEKSILHHSDFSWLRI